MTTENSKAAVSARTLERIRAFRLIDDDFMQVCFRDNIACAELVLRIIMDKPDLKVLSVRTQRLLKSLGGHSLYLDIAAEPERCPGLVPVLQALHSQLVLGHGVA